MAVKGFRQNQGNRIIDYDLCLPVVLKSNLQQLDRLKNESTQEPYWEQQPH